MENALLSIVSAKQNLSYSLIFRKIANYYYMNLEDTLKNYSLEHISKLNKLTYLNGIYIEQNFNENISRQIKLLEMEIQILSIKYTGFCKYIRKGK